MSEKTTTPNADETMSADKDHAIGYLCDLDSQFVLSNRFTREELELIRNKAQKEELGFDKTSGDLLELLDLIIRDQIADPAEKDQAINSVAVMSGTLIMIQEEEKQFMDTLRENDGASFHVICKTQDGQRRLLIGYSGHKDIIAAEEYVDIVNENFPGMH